jgi:hypothetical protein
MSDGRSIGEPLRRALAGARLRDIDVAKTLGVDPKTVQRWLGGRLPQPRHRWGLADLLSLHEYDLWPHLAGVPSIGPEIYATYPHRGSVPRDVWRQLYHSAEQHIDILVYSGLFLAEDVEMIRLLGDKPQAGVAVRIILGDPDSPHVSQRGAEEGIHSAMAAKIRNAIVLYRLHSTVLYNSIYRADGEMLINQHIYGIAAAYAPVLHLRRQGDDDVFSTYVASFERVWSSAEPLSD